VDSDAQDVAFIDVVVVIFVVIKHNRTSEQWNQGKKSDQVVHPPTKQSNNVVQTYGPL
jgi:hypothetical protein